MDQLAKALQFVYFAWWMAEGLAAELENWPPPGYKPRGRELRCGMRLLVPK